MALDRLAKLAFALAALPWVLVAAWRASRLVGRHDLEAAVAALRRPRGRLPSPLRRPLWLAALVDRLEPLLPPRDYGRCLKRSLLLLDLWARCGLEPRLHLGLRHHQELRQGHAWVTTGEEPDAPATPTLGYPEAFRL